MERIDTELDRFEIIERRHAVVAVGVKFQRHVADILSESAAISVRVRSGVSKPATSLKQMR